MREVRVTSVFGTSPQRLPFYTADRSMEDNRKPHTVDEILKRVFSEKFDEIVQGYMDRVPEAIEKAIDVKDARDFRLVEMSKPTVRSSWKQEINNLAVDFIQPVVIEASVPIESWKAGLIVITRGKKKYNVTFRIRYILDMKKKQCSAPMLAPIMFFPEDELTRNACTDEYLLPIIEKKDYDKAARKMLELYYPEALKAPTAIDGHKLAKRMKLHVQEVWFEEKSDVYGRIYFEEAWEHFDTGTGRVGYYKVPARNILINRNLCTSPQMINSTIVHECVHVFLDLPFFMLQIIGGKPFTVYSSRIRKEGRVSEAGPEAVMERQAEKLPANILMEELNTRREIERLLGERRGQRTPDTMRRVVRHLASMFKVSLSMAKYRVIELGYPEAEGVFNYLDGRPLPDYGVKGDWRRGVTYTISRLDAAKMMLEDTRFAEAVKSGRYTYVEGHFCLDSEDYILRDKNGWKRLSTYARWNIDECCISFTTRNVKSKVVYINGQAAKTAQDSDYLPSRHNLDDEPGTSERIATNQRYGHDAYLWMSIKRQRFADVKTAILHIMKEKKITQEEISMRMGVTRSSFAGWFKKEISLRHVVAICIALDVRSDVGDELVRLAGYSFRNTLEDALLLSFLFETNGFTVPRANEIMIQHNLGPLTNGKNQELAEVI